MRRREQDRAVPLSFDASLSATERSTLGLDEQESCELALTRLLLSGARSVSEPDARIDRRCSSGAGACQVTPHRPSSLSQKRSGATASAAMTSYGLTEAKV
jgi:hypothetical protein